MLKKITTRDGGDPKIVESTISRYRGLILSIVLFLLLITALMLFSISVSVRINNRTAELTAAERLHSFYQQTNQNLYSLRLSIAEDPKSPQSAATIQELYKNREGAQRALMALMTGATIKADLATAGTDIDLIVHKIDDEEVMKQLESLAHSWKPIYEQTGIYLQDAETTKASTILLDEISVIARNNHHLIHENIDNIIAKLTAKAKAETVFLRWVQIVGIAASIVYFIVFIVYFMRKLRRSDEEAIEARNETTEILNTVNSGLFLLDHDLRIGSQYSQELERLIGVREIAGRNILDILREKLPDEEVDNTASFIEQLYNTRVKERLIGSLNPLVRTPMLVSDLKTGDEKTRYLDFRFNRVYHGKDIAKVLVSVTDETDAVLLEQKMEQEREQNDIQLDMLATLLNADQKMVNDFVKSTKRRSLEINNILKQPGETQTELRAKANTIFREIHSLKGEASTFNLHGFTLLAENIESELKGMQSMITLSGQDFLGLTVSLDKLMQLTQTIEGLARRLSGGQQAQAGTPESNSLHIQDRFDSAAVQQAYYSRFVSELATRNHKKVSLSTGGLETELNEETEALVKDICVQLLRNSVVHGIEVPQVRATKQKNPVGQIQLNIAESVDGYTVSLRDDGAGIRVERVKAKAVEMGICTEEQAAQLTNQQVYALLFRSGFSTAEEVTGDAGRGVGLDVIKERVNRLGGKISISSTPGSYTRFVFTFPKK
ncbi:ATP-binding protein [Neisseriaceae bacterium B1]